MRRTLLLAAVVLVTACSGVEPETQTTPEGPSRAAEPQRAVLEWRERYPASGDGLVFEVGELIVRADGWSVTVAVTNRTKIEWEHDAGRATHGYGVALFATGQLSEVEEAAANQRLPSPRQARSIEPPPPHRLAPGATWRAKLSAPGSLADDSHLRVTFGPLYAVGDQPEGMERVIYWITDHAHRL